MNERTRADTNTKRTRTDVTEESGEWVEPAVDESVDRDALSGSRVGDQVSESQMDKSPMDSDKEDFPQSGQRVNEERPHEPRSDRHGR